MVFVKKARQTRQLLRISSRQAECPVRPSVEDIHFPSTAHDGLQRPREQPQAIQNLKRYLHPKRHVSA